MSYMKISLKMKNKDKLNIEKKYYKIWRNKNTSQIKSFNFIVQIQEIAFSDKYRKI